MLTREIVDGCLEAATDELQSMDYEELERFAEAHGMFGEWKIKRLEYGDLPVEVFVLAARLGHIRKRISIEIALSKVGNETPERDYGRYFERYKSGRLYPAKRKRIETD